MRYIYSFLIFLLMVCACNKDASEVGSLLNGIEAYIEEHPEEALKVLECVNREELTTSKLKAKHALLYQWLWIRTILMSPLTALLLRLSISINFIEIIIAVSKPIIIRRESTKTQETLSKQWKVLRMLKTLTGMLILHIGVDYYY